MNITDMKIKITDIPSSKLKGLATVTLDDCFVIHDIKIIQGNEGLFIAMPSKLSNNGEFKDIVHPINTQTRQMFLDAILGEFNKVISNNQ